MKMKTIRGSEVQDFLRCRQRWQWSWVEGLHPVKRNSKLVFGDTMHKFLQVLYGEQHQRKAAFAATRFFDEQATGMDELERQDLWDTFIHVANGYVKQYSDDFTQFDVLATEFKFAIPMGRGFAYEGTIDRLLKEKDTGYIWFTDTKTTNSIDKYDKNSDLDRQISRYWWALQQLARGRGYVGFVENPQDEVTEWIQVRKSDIWPKIKGIEPHGFFYDIILRDYPVPPKVLQSGKVSTDKRQKTTYDMYMQALVENGFARKTDIGYVHEPEYEEILTYLHISPKEFFRRTRVIRSQAEIDAAMVEFMETVKDMTSKRLRIYRNITTDCSWDCGHQELCKASLDGSNVDFLKESLYEPIETEVISCQ